MSSIYGNASRSFHIECFGSRKIEDGSLYKLCDLFSISWHHACKLIETYLQILQKPYQSLHKLMEWACTGWKLLWGCNFLSLQKPYVTKLAQADGMGLHRLKAAVELQFLKLTSHMYQSLHKLMEWAYTGWKLQWSCKFLLLAWQWWRGQGCELAILPLCVNGHLQDLVQFKKLQGSSWFPLAALNPWPWFTKGENIKEAKQHATSIEKVLCLATPPRIIATASQKGHIFTVASCTSLQNARTGIYHARDEALVGFVKAPKTSFTQHFIKGLLR